MNTKENKTEKTEYAGGLISECVKTIYIVKYREVYYMPDSRAKRDITYNLFTFEDLEDAKKYMIESYDSIVNPYVVNGDYRILFEQVEDMEISPKTGNKILFNKCIKLIGANDRHNNQTKFFTFTIETINFKFKISNG